MYLDGVVASSILVVVLCAAMMVYGGWYVWRHVKDEERDDKRG
ncbi:hypothetical protein [Marinimicrobium alkaliphilum]|nr:hypothetical protein [Marinimicrobium alkaliphilum]